MRGFITQASYRVMQEPDGRRRPVIHVHGRLEDGSTFLARDDRQRPRFYVRTVDVERARIAGAPAASPVDKRTFDGAAVSRLEVGLPGDVPALRDRLHAAGIDTFEADVRFAVRYLIERGIKAGCAIEGEASAGEAVTWVFDNPTLRPADVRIEPRVLSFDIETDARAERLLAISMYGARHRRGADRRRQRPRDAGARLRAARANSPRCTAFCDRVRSFDPDVLTGWNIVDFDLTVLAAHRRSRAASVRSRSRLAGPIRLRKAEGYFGSGQASIPGRLVLDGIDLLRGAFVRMDDYSLDAVARAGAR